MTDIEIRAFEERIVFVLKNIYDPEVPVNIYDLGLIYEVKSDKDGNVRILMTLTSPNCPVAESLPAQVREEVSFLKEVKEIDLELTFEPPWSQDMITEEAKLELGFL
ncbi:MAG: FeS assembly SUF system protein [Bacteroidetes bacterium]|nr:MAG: FeS assembly SUF system protein [Bacteroidota bacterium]